MTARRAVTLVSRLGFGHLPGHISSRGKRFSFYVAITTCIINAIFGARPLWIQVLLPDAAPAKIKGKYGTNPEH